jgi:hypothetical protein
MEGRELFIKVSKILKDDLLSRMKSLSMWDRFAETEIQLEWREVITCVILVIVSFILYLSVVFTQFSFVPLMILTIKRGWKEALLYLTCAFLIFIYIIMSGIGSIPIDNALLLFSVDHFTFAFLSKVLGLPVIRFLDYYFLFGVIGVVVGYLVSRNYKLDYVVFLSLSAYIGIFVFAIVAASAAGGFERLIEDYKQFVNDKTGRYVKFYIAQVGQYSTMLSSRGVDYAVMSKKVEVAAEICKRSVIFGMAPRGGYLIRQLIVIFLSILFTRYYFRRKLNRACFSFSIKKYAIDADWVWGLIASWGLVYINMYVKSPVLGILSWNMAVIFSFLFFLKGLSLIWILADRIRIPRLIQYAVLIFFLFYAFIVFVAVITGIGVANIWLKLDEKIGKTESRRE